MLRKHAALIIAICLVAVVAAACVVRSGPRRSQGAHPVYVEKHKKQKKMKKHKKHKKHR